jgi:acyl-coenzyme A thioesterase 7
MVSRLACCRLGFTTAASDSISLLADRGRSSRLFRVMLVRSPHNALPRMNQSSITRSITVARLCLPDDANVAGNVHGGTILRLMEEAGMITATRHMAAAAAEDSSCTASTAGSTAVGAVVGTLARFENMSFHEPLYVGEVASVTARLVFTSEHSMLVKVAVTGENLTTGKKRVTNTGELWYVPLLERKNNDGRQDQCIVVTVPPIHPPSADAEAIKDYEHAKLSYETRIKNTVNANGSAPTEEKYRKRNVVASQQNDNDFNATPRTPAASEQALCQVVLPGDCAKNRIAFGGFVMKLMDNAAACSAYRHCRTNVVTVAISSIDFVHPVTLGEICTIHSKAVFASNKTLEMQVTASVTCARRSHDNHRQDTMVAFGRFTFASLDEMGRAITVPPLELETDEDKERFFQAEQRYSAAKKARAAAAQQEAAAFRARAPI